MPDTRNVLKYILVWFLIAPASGAQKFLLAPGGKHITYDREAKTLPQELTHLKPKGRVQEEPQAVLDPGDFDLRWNDGGTFYTFGFDEGDSMGLYLEPLAGAIVHEIYMHVTDFCGDVCFSLNDALYDGEASTSGACVDGGGWVGYYGAVVDGETTWVEPGQAEFWVEGDNECWNQPPIGEEIWPGLGIGCYSVEISDEIHSDYLVLDVGEVLGHPDTVWTPFFILAAFDREDFALCPDSWGIGAWDQLELPYHGFKYYDNLSRGEPGWWVRSFGWEVFTTVEYVEDIPPFIEDMTILFITIFQDPREVSATITDFNPTGGTPGGVTEALLWYSFNDGDPVSVAMTADADTFSAEIPGGSPGEVIEYWITATDDNGNTSESRHFSYEIFKAEEPNLFVNNTMYGNWIAYYYVCNSYDLHCDVWDTHWGPATYDLLKHYALVVEAQAGGPEECSTGMERWLDEGTRTNPHSYIITGDEFLGACFYGWPGRDNPVQTEDRDFPRDYLGIDVYYGNINYGSSGDEEGVSRILPIEDDLISGSLYDFLADSLYLNYDPNYEIGASNRLDGIEVLDSIGISFLGLTGILDSALVPPSDADTLPVGSYLQLPNGSRTAFFGFDALSLNSMAVGAKELHGEGYHWIGVYPEGPIPATLLSIGWDRWPPGPAIENESQGVPGQFSLHQNYPNPFNPSTTIEFSLPRRTKVSLVVYDLLGREVERILNASMDAGGYKVQWKAENVPSGVYFVRMQAGDSSLLSGQEFTRTRKVTVLK